MLLPVALIVEGSPPAVDTSAVLAFCYLGIIGTGLAYVLWFRGLTRMSAASTALIGLVNPVVGTALGVAFAGETFGAPQAVGVTLVLAGVLSGQPAVTGRLAGAWARVRTRGAVGGSATKRVCVADTS